MGKPEIDYSLYLVTGRDLLPEGKDYYESLEEALQGGVTVVQVREKDADTGEFLEVARRSKEVCDRYNVPLFINDRVDIYIALLTLSPSSPPAGMHIGQTDLPLPLARQLLANAGAPDAVIGISCTNVDEALRAKELGADYVGVGPAYWTGTKDVSKKVIVGVRGVEEVVQAFGGPAVAIGGIKHTNLRHVLHAAPSLSGVAVVSDIVASLDPRAAAERLQAILKSFPRFSADAAARAEEGRRVTRESILSSMKGFLEVLKRETPVVNQLTNVVVANDSANATLAIGASPIMATVPSEVTQLSRIIGALLINFGTIKDVDGFLAAGTAANANGKPVVFDPVAVGASDLRRTSAQKLLNAWQPTVIKGNAGEIAALLGSDEVVSRGVDSGGKFKDPAKVVKALAVKERCIVVLTGEVDWISDGTQTVSLSNGHEYLGLITGSGCMTGSIIACFCAAARLAKLEAGGPPTAGTMVEGDHLAAACAGVLAMTVAAELAASQPDVRGPNTFRSALIDALYGLRARWDEVAQRARVEVFA